MEITINKGHGVDEGLVFGRRLRNGSFGYGRVAIFYFGIYLFWLLLLSEVKPFQEISALDCGLLLIKGFFLEL